VHEEYGFTPVAAPEKGSYDGVVLAVKHEAFISLGVDGLKQFARSGGIFYDIKEVLS
jgi:UDP-N-acetyl-D-galactosamine dehydrogenase